MHLGNLTKRQSHTRIIADSMQCMDWGDTKGQQSFEQPARPQAVPASVVINEDDIPF